MADHFKEAEGYFELDLIEDAWLSLQELSPSQQNSASVLLLRCRIYVAQGKWADLAAIAENAAKLHPGEKGLLELGADAIEALAGEGAARGFVKRVAQELELEALELYERAREAAREERYGEVGELIRAAAVVMPEVKSWALDDPDFEGWWEAM